MIGKASAEPTRIRDACTGQSFSSNWRWESDRLCVEIYDRCTRNVLAGISRTIRTWEIGTSRSQPSSSLDFQMPSISRTGLDGLAGLISATAFAAYGGIALLQDQFFLARFCFTHRWRIVRFPMVQRPPS